MANQLFFIAGPCVVESYVLLDEVASELADIANESSVRIIFKASYRKANRTSIDSFTGVGDEKALNWIKEIGDKYKLETLTDVHTPEEAIMASNYVDALQVPAFLSRQTDLLIACGKTNKIVNIKKGQFLSPDAMALAAEKVASTGNNKIMLTERGTFFGYNDLVVDFRSLKLMQHFGYPVVYDATHSLQKPSIGKQSSGMPELIPYLARAAVAVGIQGVFFETHPDPKNAKSDRDTQLDLKYAKKFISDLLKINNLIQEL
ncbi:MAG TPA: 3-deoxy-8-phosphooctulonate synthase [Bacteroidota bacterium]|nr:3-deoxy-8-phosphooctulonate synthase [Candidatus Kapabacteria bacterium]HRS00998.1 3-deoxy-8-phosphooctulonate synthase [Bacteroidota bacterium]